MSHGRLGATLLEVLIALGLAGLLGSLVVTIIVPAMRFSFDTGTRSQMQQQAMVLMGRLEYDLRQTSGAGIGLLASTGPTAPVALTVHRLAAGAFAGVPQYEDHLVVYAWMPQARSLIRKLWPPQPPVLSLAVSTGHAAAPSAQDLQAMVLQPNGTESILSHGVTKFSIDPSGSGSLTVHLEVQQEGTSRETLRTYEISKTLFVRNHP